MEIVVARVHGWITNGRNSVPLRRLYVDRWSEKALVAAGRELDELVSKLPLLSGGKLVSRGAIMLEIGKGLPDQVLKFVKEVQPHLTDSDLDGLMEEMLQPQESRAKPGKE